jgi:hypothetical protein
MDSEVIAESNSNVAPARQGFEIAVRQDQDLVIVGS